MSRDCYRSLSLPRGASGWSVACIVAFPDHTNILFLCHRFFYNIGMGILVSYHKINVGLCVLFKLQGLEIVTLHKSTETLGLLMKR